MEENEKKSEEDEDGEKIKKARKRTKARKRERNGEEERAKLFFPIGGGFFFSPTLSSKCIN